MKPKNTFLPATEFEVKTGKSKRRCNEWIKRRKGITIALFFAAYPPPLKHRGKAIGGSGGFASKGNRLNLNRHVNHCRDVTQFQ